MSGKEKKKFGAFKIIAVVVAVLIIGLIALPFFLDVNQFQPQLEAKLTDALGRDVKTGNLSLSLFSGAVGVADIVIADDPKFSSSPFIQAKSLKVGVELKPLIFSKEIHITEISLDNPAINLIRSTDGRWNFSSLGKGAGEKKNEASENEPGGNPGKDVSIKQLRISDGSITIDRGGKGKKPTTYSDVDIAASNLSFSTTFPFSLSASLPGGGSLSLSGDAGPISNSDLIKTPMSANLTVKRFDMIKSGFVSPEAGLGGIIDFDGKLVSDGEQVESQGTAKTDRFQLVKGGAPAGQTVSLDYTVDYDLGRQKGVLNNAKLMYGKAVATLSGNYRRQPDGLAMKMRLRGDDMPVEDVKSLLPAFGIVLPKGASLAGGVFNTDMTAEGPVDKMKITGSSDISNTRLTGFDLAGKMAVIAQLAGIESNPETVIETLASHVRMNQEGIRVSDMKLVVPAIGKLTGNGVISPEQSLDFKMKAQVNTSEGIGLALTQLVGSGGGSGKLTIPFFIQGTSSDPKFIPDAKNTARSILEAQFSGEGTQEGATDTGKAIGDAIRGLFGN